MMTTDPTITPPFREGLLRRYPWLAFVLPLLVYMAVGSLEPPPPGEAARRFDWGLRYHHYPAIYTIKIGLTLAVTAYCWTRYTALAPIRCSPLAFGIGVVGVVVWIALATWERSTDLGAWLGLGQRSAFNPLAEIPSLPLAYAFLAVRWLGLAAVVPVIEEMFLRGFLMRYISTENWERLPLEKVSRGALVAGTAVPMLMHPQELLASFVWFSAVSWLMLRTGNIWDCVVAHAVTNFLLGCYVLYTGNWWLM